MKPLEVHEAAGRPSTFTLRGKKHQVLRLLEEWREAGEWWAGDPPKQVFRVMDRAGGVYELLRDLPQGMWRLAKVYD